MFKFALFLATVIWTNNFLESRVSHEARLFKDLFEDYISDVRPTINNTDTVNVVLGISITELIEVYEKDQDISVNCYVRQKWNDPLLTWDPKKYNNIKEINVNPSKIWKPDIMLYNNVDKGGGSLDSFKTQVILTNDGNISWLAPSIFRSQCPIDVTHFPFDTQRCELVFGSWIYDMTRLNLLIEGDGADFSNYASNSEWKLGGHLSERTEVKYNCCAEKYSIVTYTIVIARRSLFYLSNTIFPMTIIGMLTILSFLLPAESGERVSLAITLLLSMTVFMLIIADIIPATSEVVPLVGIFFSVSMITMVIMIIVLCYVLRLYHKTASDPPMPLWVRRFILEWLSFKVCIRRRDDNNKEKEVFNNNTVGDEVVMNGRSATIPGKIKKTSDPDKALLSKLLHEMTEVGVLSKKVDTIIEKFNDAEKEDEIKSEWRIVAMTIDRCLLVTFALVYIITIFACFCQSPGYVS